MWKKSTSTYVANWKTFSLTPRSVGQLAAVGTALGFAWALLWCVVIGLPGSEARAAADKWRSMSAAESHEAPQGSCSTDYAAWAKMPDGPAKASKLVYWKKAYGSLNFHPTCSGAPRHVGAAEAIQ
jgi:hypothetical protein